MASSDATRPALVAAEGQTTAEVISEALPTRTPTRYAATADVAQDQLIIVGGQEDADPAPVSLGGLVWVSDDGRRTRLTGDAQFGDAVLSAATAQKGRQVVVGYDVFTTLFIATGQVNPITWSTLGDRWSVVGAAAVGGNGLCEHDQDARCGRGEHGGGRWSRGDRR